MGLLILLWKSLFEEDSVVKNGKKLGETRDKEGT